MLVSREWPYWQRSALTTPVDLRWAALDDDGCFALESVPAGPVWVTALIPGSLRRTARTLELPFDGRFEFSIDDVDEPVVGRLRDIESDEPLAGARIVWQGHYDGYGPCCGIATTATDGSYVLFAPRGVEAMHLQRAGDAERRLENQVGLGNGTYRLRRSTWVEGLVVEAGSGEPVPGLIVERSRPGDSYPATRALTDAGGRFRLEDQAPGWATITTRGNGWIPKGRRAESGFERFESAPATDPDSWYVAPGQPLVVKLEVERGATIEGRVVDPEGRPVAGVPIGGWEPPPLAATGSDGAFRLSGYRPRSRLELWANPSGRAPAAVALTLPPAPGSHTSVVIRLPEPHWILVTVIDSETKTPIAGAEVSLMFRSRDSRIWWTGDDGVARVGPIGAHKGTLDVRARGFLDANQHPAPAATKEGAPVTVAMDRALTIRGTVRLPDGSPASAAVVFTSNVSDAVIDMNHYRGRDQCRADGSFMADSVRA